MNRIFIDSDEQGLRYQHHTPHHHTQAMGMIFYSYFFRFDQRGEITRPKCPECKQEKNNKHVDGTSIQKKIRFHEGSVFSKKRWKKDTE
ncbi:MAG: hypothetical protein IPO25_15890 [Saprospiraceae bacterium]|nr:hypothetical protein [Saprospiraceae bacterium]